MEPVIVVHGGSGDIPASRVPLKIAGCKKAATEGYKLMRQGASALDAVEAAVHVMEDDPAFNAGYGSVLNLDGEVEMDASVMIGNDMRAGCVSIVKDVAHPISLARRVMEVTPHVILSGEGCKKFAIAQGFEILEKGALVTNDAKEALEYFKEHGEGFSEIGSKNEKADVGTVGAVAIDAKGTLAVATSTGGITGKMVGRCSDTSQIGSGSYANKHAAVSTTERNLISGDGDEERDPIKLLGKTGRYVEFDLSLFRASDCALYHYHNGYGEAILKFCLAHTVVMEVQNGKSAQEATSVSIQAMLEQLNKTAGAITITNDGNVGIYFSSRSMSWAYISKKKLHYGLERNQHEIDPHDV